MHDYHVRHALSQKIGFSAVVVAAAAAAVIFVIGVAVAVADVAIVVVAVVVKVLGVGAASNVCGAIAKTHEDLIKAITQIDRRKDSGTCHAIDYNIFARYRRLGRYRSCIQLVECVDDPPAPIRFLDTESGTGVR
jgi:hypothetical protein